MFFFDLLSVAELILSWASPSKVASSMAHGFFDRFFEGVGSPSVFRSFGCLGGPKTTPEDPGEPPKQAQKRQKHVRKGPRSRQSRPKPPREAPRAPRECPRRRQEAPRWPKERFFEHSWPTGGCRKWPPRLDEKQSCVQNPMF